MSIGAGVVVAVALQQIDRAPNAEAGAQRHNEGLQNTDRTIEKCHIFVLLKDSGWSIRPARKVVVLVVKIRVFPVWPAGWMPAIVRVGTASFPAGRERKPYAIIAGKPALGSGEQAGQQGDEGDADEGNAAPGHQLCYV